MDESSSLAEQLRREILLARERVYHFGQVIRIQGYYAGVSVVVN